MQCQAPVEEDAEADSEEAAEAFAAVAAAFTEALRVARVLREDLVFTAAFIRADGDFMGEVAGEFIGRKLRLDYTPVHLKVITDEKWLCFVLEQLLSNALKYTREGGIRIYLEQPRTLCIADTGVGIAPEDLPRIFEKGYTGYNGRADKKASGLGLYLCRSICTRLGHRISASSSPDSGTVVRIDLNQYPLQAE